MILKEYQQQAIDWYELFLCRCRDLKSHSQAYEETTREWYGSPLLYRPLRKLPDVPYVCLRIPTGGGKTLVGGMTIPRVNQSYLFVQHSITLWLVPSEPILTQTLKALKDPNNLLHQAVFSALDSVEVMDIDEAMRITPAVANSSNIIIVSTMQSFKQDDKDRLTAYKQNTDMVSHFDGITDAQVRGNTSFVDMLRLRHPFVIVDEAHNQGTPLAFETLSRFEPCAILELTATPDRSHQPSNVLFSVSAASLQAAEMIKLPLELIRRPNWQDALRDAIARLNHLQEKADEEKKLTGEYIRPVMLLQAERHDSSRETLVPEKVKKALMDDFGIPEGEIAIATGAEDTLGKEDILSETCRLRYIITIDKLKEGWDCPFAYILCTFRNTNSSTAAEQVLGRILRMPRAYKKQNQELNEAYAFVTSSDFQATVECLRDGLVKNGFERQETKDLIHAPEESDELELFSPTSITFATPEVLDPESIPSNWEDKFEIIPESGSITIKGNWNTKQAEEAVNVFKTDEGKAAARKAFEKLKTPIAKKPKFPSEMDVKLKVPLLAFRNGELWEAFEETHLLQGEWRLLDYPGELSENQFSKDEGAVQGGRFSIDNKEKVNFKYFDRLTAELSFVDHQEVWDQCLLTRWLERNIPEDTISPDEKAAFLNKAITYLIDQRGFTLEQLTYLKFQLRSKLDEKIKTAKLKAMKSVHQGLIGIPDNFIADDRCFMLFEQGKYAYNTPYNGFTELPKHFFPVIGDLKADGEEFECAVFLATQLEGVKYWVRNISHKSTSFSLQTSTDRFYPDFVCLLEDGRVLVVEYKNERDWDLPDSKEKRQIGELWEHRSNGKGLFIMPRGKDWKAITMKVGSG